MRSGQYKINSSPGPHSGALGHFKTHSNEVSEFPHMNSLVVTASRFNDSNNSPSNLKNKKSFSERAKDTIRATKSNEGHKGGNVKGNSHHRSAESLSGTRNAFNRVEQKVRVLLQQGEAKLKAEVNNNPKPTNPTPEKNYPQDDSWQYGHLVTLPRKNKQGMSASSSGINTVGVSDNSSCISASSGYSSSSSSSYGSFNGSASKCSRLPLHEEEPSEYSTNSSTKMTLVDNPLYDVTPAHSRVSLANLLYENPQVSPLTRPSYKTISSSEGSRLAHLHENPTLHDPVARRCRDFFQQRMANTESLCNRWSVCSQDSGADFGDNESPPSSMSTTSTTGPVSIASTSSSNSSSCTSGAIKKTRLDHKMDFLRKEIADLVHQDNALFHQLLTLHHSINALKQDQEVIRSESPSSDQSYSDDEEISHSLEEESQMLSKDDNGRETLIRKSSHPFGQQDAYVPPNSYVTSDPFVCNENYVNISSLKAEKIEANQKSIPIFNTNQKELNNNQKCNNNPQKINDNEVVQHLYENTCSTPKHEHSSSSASEKSDDGGKSDAYTLSDIDEGLCTDMSFSHSTSPASTLSKASSSSGCSSRDLTTECSPSSPTNPPLMRGCFSGNPFFSRARKSYAPTARNRQNRSSSAHQSEDLKKSIEIKHAETSQAKINPKNSEKCKFLRPRPHSSGPPELNFLNPRVSSDPKGESQKTLTHSCSMSVASNRSRSKINIIKLSRSNTKETVPARSISLPLSSSNTISMHSSPARRSNTVHPPYREVLIM